MNSGIFTFVSIFLMNYGLTIANKGFFESSSEPENNWDPSKDFFSYPTGTKDSTSCNSDVSQSEGKCNPWVTRSYDYQLPKIDGNTGDRIEDATGLVAATSKTAITKKEDLRYKAYLSRFINIFLKSTGFSDDTFEDDHKTLTIDLTLSKKDFTILKKFATDEDISIEALENSFRSMFSNKREFSPKPPVFNMYLIHAILIALLLAIVTYTVLMIVKININKSLMILMLSVAYISIVSHGLLKQYEDISEKIILRRMEFENLAAPPQECFSSRNSFLENLYFQFFKDNICERFLQSRKSVWIEMDIVSAFIKPFHLIFSALCSMFGEGSEKLMKPLADKSPWPINIVINIIASLMQIPLLFFGLCFVFFTLTSRNVSLKIPFFTLSAERKNEIKHQPQKEITKEEDKSDFPKASIKTYVINQGGILLFGDEDKKSSSFNIQRSHSLEVDNQSQFFEISRQGFNIQRSNSLGTNSPSQSHEISRPGIFMNHQTSNLDNVKLRGIISKQIAENKKEVRREQKKHTYFRKMNFKPSKKSGPLKIVKENLELMPGP